jgi:hypothetical protein
MNRLIPVLVLLVAPVFSAFAQQAVEPTLIVRLRSDKASYSINGNIQLEIVRENAGNHQMIVPRWWGWGWGRTNIRVFDAKGKTVITTFLADELPPPPQAWDFIVLDGGQFIGTRLHEPAKHFVDKPGSYEFVVEYTSYLSEQYAREAMRMPDAPFWSRERGEVVSNRIKLTVTDRE